MDLLGCQTGKGCFLKSGTDSEAPQRLIRSVPSQENDSGKSQPKIITKLKHVFANYVIQLRLWIEIEGRGVRGSPLKGRSHWFNNRVTISYSTKHVCVDAS